MTACSRNVKGSSGVNFAKQLADRNAPAQAQRRFKSSAAPKGTKLATGYHDRTRDRQEEENDDERGKRIKALEEQVKLGQIDQETFERLRDTITGGDISATHLVKGLDRQLLERVRRGENVMDEAPKGQPVVNEDEEFEALEQKEVAPVAKEKTIKKGEMAPPPPGSGVKRSRDAILAELKASRKAAAEAAAAAEPQLGSKFRRIGRDPGAPRIEIDERGREVLLVKGPDGKIKRKVRKAPVPTAERALLEVDKTAKPLGIEESLLPLKPLSPPSDDDDDDDIFEGVGAEYDPLADLGSDSSGDSEGEEGEVSESKGRVNVGTGTASANEEQKVDADTVLKAKQSTARRNYFNDSSTTENMLEAPTNPLQDPSILAALQHASRKAELQDGEEGSGKDAEQEARLKRRAAMLASADRDMDDLDMGFGSSRFDDAAEGEDAERVKLSQWKGTADEKDDDGKLQDRGGKQRKRGPKKRKGDKNNAADVMSVIERRQG